MNTKIVIRRVGVVSLAKMMGCLYALLGLIIGACFSLFALLAGSMNLVDSGFGLSKLVGVGAIILFPILYGVIGLIGGLITGALYNLVAAMAGGVEFQGVQTPN